jgi:hypothetical protein
MATCADASTVSIWTLSPIWRHWSMSQMPRLVGLGNAAILEGEREAVGTPASRSSRGASARLAVISRP